MNKRFDVYVGFSIRNVAELPMIPGGILWRVRYLDKGWPSAFSLNATYRGEMPQFDGTKGYRDLVMAYRTSLGCDYVTDLPLDEFSEGHWWLVRQDGPVVISICEDGDWYIIEEV